MKNLIYLSLVFVLSACGTQTVKVLDASWVSMKNSSPPSPKDKLVKVGAVDDEYCVTAWSGSYGLMDEAVLQAEKKHNIDYIKYPAFTRRMGTACVQVSGEGYRVVQ
jgi:hypothetical protein